MERRYFISLVAGAAVWSPVARAQQPSAPMVGFLSATAAGEYASSVTGFQQGLREAGYTAGRNVGIEYRWAEGRYDRLPALAADLVDRRVEVIFTGGSTPATLAAKAATTTIPIVFFVGGDPVELGLVDSLTQRQSHRRDQLDWRSETA